MKNKRMVLTLLVGALLTAAVFGRDYNLNERETVSLSGVDEVIFNLKGVPCSLCIRTLNILSDLRGDGPGRDMSLALSGSISSNREKAVPSLIINEGGRRITVQLYPDRQSFFSLSQSGTANFSAVLPASFKGKVTVSGSSDDISVSHFDVGDMDLESSSGDMDVENLQGETLSMKVSSGDFRGNGIAAGTSLSIESSSGDIELGRVSAPSVDIEASSGEISIVEARAAGKIEVRASSGNIAATQISGGSVVLDTSSGEIEVENLEAGSVRIDVSSGDVQLGNAAAESMDIRLSSGGLKIDVLDSDLTEIKTSGDTLIRSGRGEINLKGSSGKVGLILSEMTAPLDLDVSSGDITVTLPEGTAFDVDLETSSGRIRSEFPVLGLIGDDNDAVTGTVNGGGATLKAETSSGDINILSR